MLKINIKETLSDGKNIEYKILASKDVMAEQIKTLLKLKEEKYLKSFIIEVLEDEETVA